MMNRLQLIIGFMSACAVMAQADSVLTVTEDATIKLAAADKNYGSEPDLIGGSTGSDDTIVINKTYLRFDASGLDFQIRDITSVSAFALAKSKPRDCQVWLITNSKYDTVWNEDTITWNNAPGNTKSKYFNEQAGIQIGTVGSLASGESSRTVNMTFSTPEAKTALINELNTGDRMATLVLIRGAVAPSYASLENTVKGAHPFQIMVK